MCCQGGVGVGVWNDLKSDDIIEVWSLMDVYKNATN